MDIRITYDDAYYKDDDKFIIALDESKNLKVYNYKEASKIDNNVTKIVSAPIYLN